MGIEDKIIVLVLLVIVAVMLILYIEIVDSEQDMKIRSLEIQLEEVRMEIKFLVNVLTDTTKVKIERDVGIYRWLPE